MTVDVISSKNLVPEIWAVMLAAGQISEFLSQQYLMVETMLIQHI